MKLRRKRVLVSLVIMGIFILSLGAGCAIAKKVKISAMRWLSWPEERLDYDKWIKDYEANHPNVEIKIEWLTTGYSEKLMSRFAAGNAPDFTFVYHVYLPEWAEQGMLAPIDKYISGPNGIDVKDTYKNMWLKYKGKTYAYATEFAPQLLYYNRKLFDQAGVAYPNGNWTWDDLAKAAKKLTLDTDNDGRIDIYGFQCDELNRMFLTYVWTQGGRLFNEDYTESYVNSPEAVEAAEYIFKLTKVLGAAPAPGVPGAVGYRESFRMGKAAMILDGIWMIDPFSRRKGLDYATEVVPRGKIRAVWNAPCQWMITTQSKHPDIAWDVIKFLTTPDKMLVRASYGGPLCKIIPAWRSALKDTRWRPGYLAKPAVKELEYARVEPEFVGSGKWFWSMLLPALQKIIVKKESAKKVLDELNKETEKLLKGGI